MQDAVDVIGELHVHPGLSRGLQSHLYGHFSQVYIVVHIVLFPLIDLHQDFPLVVAGGDEAVPAGSRKSGIALDHGA